MNWNDLYLFLWKSSLKLQRERERWLHFWLLNKLCYMLHFPVGKHSGWVIGCLVNGEKATISPPKIYIYPAQTTAAGSLILPKEILIWYDYGLEKKDRFIFGVGAPDVSLHNLPQWVIRFRLGMQHMDMMGKQTFQNQEKGELNCGILVFFFNVPLCEGCSWSWNRLSLRTVSR